jgi:peptidoglycan-associated lipoprotein
MKVLVKMFVAVAAVSLLASGCRYNKGAGSSSAADDAFDNKATGIETQNDATAGSLDELEANAGDSKKFEEIYTRCTDVSFEPIYFGLDSSVVPQNEFPKVDAVVKHLADNKDRVVVVEGHCDDRGANEYNMTLGEKRAIIIRNYLCENGVAADRIQTRSYGEEKPAVVGSNEGAWSKNRRGEFVIFKK